MLTAEEETKKRKWGNKVVQVSHIYKNRATHNDRESFTGVFNIYIAVLSPVRNCTTESRVLVLLSQSSRRVMSMSQNTVTASFMRGGKLLVEGGNSVSGVFVGWIRASRV